MKWLHLAAAVLAVFVTATAVHAQTADGQPTSGCLKCHQGIEPIRHAESEMMQEIFALGRGRGDPAGCVVCHGGDARAEDKEAAHTGRAFYPDPGSPWINKKTCGPCHSDHVRTQWHSIMMTEAGKIQGTAWAFGGMTGYEHRWGNYNVENPKDKNSRMGTSQYRAYMERLKALQPQVFVDKHEQLPEAPTDLAKLLQQPDLAVFTYLRNQCQRCHHAVKGRQVRGDYRGMGCSSCH
ncbi:MAG: cytochrome c3 family protein, partial [Thermoguttaceae bacterium]